MLGALTRLVATAGIGMAVVVLIAQPAGGQADATPIDCDDEPTQVGCQRNENEQAAGGGSSSGSARVCRFEGAEVPCETSYGTWVGDAVDGAWYGIGGDVWPAVMVGCWATVTDIDGDPPADYQGEQSGAWYALSCLARGGSWPSPGPEQFALAWAPAAADTAPGPDPEVLARRAFAAIELSVPQLVVSPPAGGRLPLGMPVWLSVAETTAGWGPVSNSACDQGLCVQVRARVARVRWDMGDGSEVSCPRSRNVAWRPGLDFLSPGGEVCHHVYRRPSRDEPGGVFEVTATAVFRAQWSGGGQSGVFEDVTEVCGAGGDAVCASSMALQVDEVEVLVTR